MSVVAGEGGEAATVLAVGSVLAVMSGYSCRSCWTRLAVVSRGSRWTVLAGLAVVPVGPVLAWCSRGVLAGLAISPRCPCRVAAWPTASALLAVPARRSGPPGWPYGSCWPRGSGGGCGGVTNPRFDAAGLIAQARLSQRPALIGAGRARGFDATSQRFRGVSVAGGLRSGGVALALDVPSPARQCSHHDHEERQHGSLPHVEPLR
ncbi:hypothetical protein [Cutibacterium avidum]|uniref:hypothetical protein n=1 Tax=Cutibacterium avidum TaxID=33010 RepID=UPI002FEEB0D7